MFLGGRPLGGRRPMAYPPAATPTAAPEPVQSADGVPGGGPAVRPMPRFQARNLSGRMLRPGAGGRMPQRWMGR